jgi:hypothetical protein
MNVTMWERGTSDSQIFGCGKIYFSNSTTMTNFVQTLIPNCWFENIFTTYFGTELLEIINQEYACYMESK